MNNYGDVYLDEYIAKTPIKNIELTKMESDLRREESRYKRAQAMSVGSRRSLNESKTRKTKKSMLMVTIAGVMMAASVVYGAHSFATDMKIDNETSEIAQVVRDSVHRTDDFENYFYDSLEIAYGLANSGNFDESVYSAYNKITYNQFGVMQEVFNYYKDIALKDESLPYYDSFEDYCYSADIINNDGSINKDKWKKMILDKIDENQDISKSARGR